MASTMESVGQVGFGVCLAIILPMSLAMTVRTWIRRRTWMHPEGKVMSVKTKRQTSGLRFAIGTSIR